VGGANSLRGGAEDYLHEAALAHAPPSGTFYNPALNGAGLLSLGTHEHWQDPVTKLYSRNAGLDRGIELLSLKVTPPELAPIPDLVVEPGKPLEVHIETTSSNSASAKMKFTLLDGPAGMALDERTGKLHWTPEISQLGSHTVTIEVVEDEVTHLNSRANFRIRVVQLPKIAWIREGESLVLRFEAAAEMQVRLEFKDDFTSADWHPITDGVVTNGPVLSHSVTISIAQHQRYYRVVGTTLK
jgi:hypothetical protein